MIRIVTKPPKEKTSNSAKEQVEKSNSELKASRQGKTKIVWLRRGADGFWHKA